MAINNVINGKFLADRMQGIVRYASEITKALDKCMDDEIVATLLAPLGSNIPASMLRRANSQTLYVGILP